MAGGWCGRLETGSMLRQRLYPTTGRDPVKQRRSYRRFSVKYYCYYLR